MKYLDAVALAKLRNLRFSLRRGVTDGHLAGRHRSTQFGFSQEFVQHREYAPGDELKYLDWKVYARKDRYVVKQFQEDKSLGTYLLVDASGSMAYRGSGLASKWEHACGLAMGMAYLAVAGGDAAGLATFDVEPRDFIPPRRQLTHLELMDATLAARSPRGETELGAVLRRMAGLIRRRSLIVLCSDLMGEPREILGTIRTLRARKHDVFVLQVLDPVERDLPLEGPILFESLENAEILRCEADLVRRAYREEFDRRMRSYQADFRRSSIAHAVCYTDVPWERSLESFLCSGS